MIISPRAPGSEWVSEGMKGSYHDFPYRFVKDLVVGWGEGRIMELKYDEIMLKTAIIRDEMISLQLGGENSVKIGWTRPAAIKINSAIVCCVLTPDNISVSSFLHILVWSSV